MGYTAVQKHLLKTFAKYCWKGAQEAERVGDGECKRENYDSWEMRGTHFAPQGQM